MLKSKTIVILLTAVSVLLAASALGFAGDIKSRMNARIPALTQMKQAGAIGENNKGYLTILSGSIANRGVVNAENQDRKTVYAYIAKKNGTTVELVGKRRALKIAGIARSGEMLQDQNGTWYKK